MTLVGTAGFMKYGSSDLGRWQDLGCCSLASQCSCLGEYK